MKISVVTPTTKGREPAFELCTRWINRQTHEDFDWIVANVSDKAAGPENAIENLIDGIRRAQGDIILVLEDDDWYGKDLLVEVEEHMREHDILSAHFCALFHARHRRYEKINREPVMKPGRISKGYCGLAFRKEYKDRVRRDVADRKWGRRSMAEKRRLLYNSLNVVNIKGLVNNGWTTLHKKLRGGMPDPNGDMLASVVGREDADIIYGTIS